MASFLSSFRALLIAIGVVAAIETSVWLFATPAPIPGIIESHLGGLSYVNSGFGADVGYFGHHHVARTLLNHLDSVKALVLYVTPLAKPAHYGNAGRELERAINTSFVSAWHYLAPPSQAFRLLMTNLMYYGEKNNEIPHGFDAFFGDFNWKQSFFQNKGFIAREAAMKTRDPLLLTGCRFANWFEPSADGEIPFDFFYAGLERMAQLARDKKVRLVVVFNPVPCHATKDVGTLTIEREIARFRQNYPEVVFPFDFLTTWPEELYMDSWHFFSFAAEKMSHRLGQELRKIFDDPTWTGVPARTVEEVNKEIEAARHDIARPSSCQAEWGNRTATRDAEGIYTNCIGMRFATVPAGRFIMGSCQSPAECPSGALPDLYAANDEMPARGMNVERAFQISQTPVTIEQFYAFLDNDEAVGMTGLTADLAQDPQFHDANQGDRSRPVTLVTWRQAEAFVNWLNRVKPPSDDGNYRLPSEAEWEYAARGGTQTPYWWGNTPGRNMAGCLNCGDHGEGIPPVASFPPNRYGLFDMGGTVWEWVQDCYRSWYSRGRTGARAYETANCPMRSIRGGAAGHPAHQVRPAVRLANTPTSRSPLIGFRVAREAPDLHRSVPAPAIPGRDGIAIASGGSPESAFDGDSATFWVSPERGVETKGRSWIGFDYSLPHSLRRIEIEQPDNPVYQQNRVLVQSSRDGGRTWETAADGRLESDGTGDAVAPACRQRKPAGKGRCVGGNRDSLFCNRPEII